MYRSKHNSGFTLVELLVGIAIGSLVTAAAMSLMLLGVRINRQSIDTVIRQNETRIVLTALENVAAEGNIAKPDIGPDYWKVYQKKDEGSADGSADESDKGCLLFSYNAADQAIFAGDGMTPILENVIASSITVNDHAVLTFSVETEDGSYSTSVYCRTLQKEKQGNLAEDKRKENEGKQDSDTPARMAFLKKLTSQYRLIGGSPNPGLVLDDEGYSTGKYYSQWYINTTDNPEWDSETPWCACFVSWGLHQIADEYIESIPTGMGYNVSNDEDSGYRYFCEKGCYHWFASVKRFAEAFQMEHVNTENGYRWENSLSHKSAFDDAYEPKEGDIIFIDWERDDSLDHVGVVLSLVDEAPDDGWDKITHVYTIEGNSAGIVAVRRYPIDSNMIVGYGIIDWKEAPVPETN